MALFQNSYQNLALVGWCFFFGGGGRLGGGGLAPGWGEVSGRLVGVAVRLVCCLWCSFMCTNQMFFQSLYLLCFSSVCCRLLPGEFFPLLCSLAWLAVAFFRSGLLCTAELRFSDRFFQSVFPHRGNVFLQSKKVRWSFALFLDFQFCAFFVCFRFFFGLVCCASHSFGFYSLGLVQSLIFYLGVQ